MSSQGGIDFPVESIAAPRSPDDLFRSELESLLNSHSRENESNTPDFILAQYLTDCLRAFDHACRWRESWYGHHHEPGGVSVPVAGQDER